MTRPKVETVKRAILDTPLEVKATVWWKGTVQRKGRQVSIREHHYGYYDGESIVLGRYMNKQWGQTEELVNTHIHEALHVVRPDWEEEKVREEEKRYVRSRVLREASLVKILNVTLFGRDLDAVRERGAAPVHVGEAPTDSQAVGTEVREPAPQP